jgi:hypothetical protein
MLRHGKTPWSIALTAIAVLSHASSRPAHGDYAFSGPTVTPVGPSLADYTWTVVVSKDEPFASFSFAGPENANNGGTSVSAPPGWEFDGDIQLGDYSWDRVQAPGAPPVNDGNGTYNFTLEILGVTALDFVPAVSVDFYNPDGTNTTTTIMEPQSPTRSKWIAVPVPEPMSIALFVLGGTSLVGYARRRRASAERLDLMTCPG